MLLAATDAPVPTLGGLLFFVVPIVLTLIGITAAVFFVGRRDR